MKRHMILATFLFSLLLIGCNGADNNVEDEKGRQYSIHAKSPLSVTQAEFTKFSVSVSRTKWDDDITVKITKLPKGVSVDTTEWRSKEGDNEHIFKLSAAAKAPLKTDAQLVIEATSGKEKATKTVKVKITESLENKLAKKEEFLQEKQTQLKTMNTRLGAVQKQIAKIEEISAKKELAKQLADAYEELEDADQAFQKLKTVPPEQWERHRDELTSQFSGLQNQVQEVEEQLRTDLKTQNKKKDKQG